MRMMSTVRGLRDNHGKPLMFGITFDGTLAAVGAAFGEAEAARLERPDATLPFAHAVAGSQNKKGEIWLAASFGTDADATSNLYVCGPLSHNPANWPVKDDNGIGVARLTWKQKRTQGEKTHIPEIQIGTSDDGQGPPMILIATTLKNSKVPRYERLSAAPDDDTAEEFPKFEDATEVLDVVLGSQPKARGVYALYRIGERQRLEFVGAPHPVYKVKQQITLTPPPGAMSLKSQIGRDGRTELIVRGNGVFRFSSEKHKSHAQGVKIADDTVSPVRVTSRSVLTDDYGHNERGEFGARKAFRCTITVPADTCQVQVWTTEATQAEVDGKAVKLDPVKALRVMPSAVSRITVSLPVNGVTCPTLMIRTNEMNYHQRLYIFPDVGLHRSIVELPDRALFEARERLGMSGMSEKSAAGIQKVLQNLTGSIQYTHNRTDYGFHHDRTVYANNMEDTHFSLSTGAGEHAYQALDQQQARSAVGGAQPITVDDLKIALGNLESVTITTLEKLGGDIVNTAQRVGDDILQTVDKMGDDLVRGDLLGLLKDFRQGGENVGMDMFQGLANVFIDASVGEARILVAVVKLAGKTLQFVLDHTGKVGKFLSWLLEQIGVQIEKFTDWLAKTIGWDDILKTHDVVGDAINNGLDMLAGRVKDVHQRGDELIEMTKENMKAGLDSAVTRLGGVPERNQPLSNEFSEASEWLAHRLATHPDSRSKIQTPSNLSRLEGSFGLIEQVLESHLGSDGHEVITALNAARSDFEKYRQNIDDPKFLMAGIFEVVKALSTIALNVVRAIWDLLMSALEDLLKAFKEMLNKEWEVPFLSEFYASITKGKKLSLLGVTSLLIAIPATPLYRSIMKEEPFTKVNFAMGLDPMPSDIVKAGIISACAQSAMTVTNILVGGATIAKAFINKDKELNDQWIFAALSVVSNALSITSNIYSVVTGYQHSTRNPFWDYHDAVTAPASMGTILLNYSFVPIGIGLFSTLGSSYLWLRSPEGDAKKNIVKFIDLAKCCRSLSSIGQIVIASMQQDLEYKKKALLNTMPKEFWTSSDQGILRSGLLKIISQGLSEPDRNKAHQKISEASLETLKENRKILKNYHDWANNGGIAEKGYAIFMGIFPHSAQILMTDFATKLTDIVAPVAGAGLIHYCRWTGATTTAVRTSKHALL